MHCLIRCERLGLVYPHGRLNDAQGRDRSVRLALLEIIAVLLAHGVRDVREADDRHAVDGGKGVERRGFHLDCQHAAIARGGNGVAVSRYGASVVQVVPR
jgi:hypothetical protein